MSFLLNVGILGVDVFRLYWQLAMKRVEDRGGTQIATKVGLFIIPLDAVIDVNKKIIVKFRALN